MFPHRLSSAIGIALKDRIKNFLMLLPCPLDE